MDPHIWPCKSRTTSTNIHSAAMWGYGMLSWRPAKGDERMGGVAREGQGYPCYQHDMMMMMMIYIIYMCINQSSCLCSFFEITVRKLQKENISIFQLFAFFSFSLCIVQEQKNLFDGKFSLLWINSGCSLLTEIKVVCSYLKVQERIVGRILGTDSEF